MLMSQVVERLALSLSPDAARSAAVLIAAFLGCTPQCEDRCLNLSTLGRFPRRREQSNAASFIAEFLALGLSPGSNESTRGYPSGATLPQLSFLVWQCWRPLVDKARLTS